MVWTVHIGFYPLLPRRITRYLLLNHPHPYYPIGLAICQLSDVDCAHLFLTPHPLPSTPYNVSLDICELSHANRIHKLFLNNPSHITRELPAQRMTCVDRRGMPGAPHVYSTEQNTRPAFLLLARARASKEMAQRRAERTIVVCGMYRGFKHPPFPCLATASGDRQKTEVKPNEKVCKH